MIVDCENSPQNSILYAGSVMISYLKKNGPIVAFNDLYKHCKGRKMEYSIFILTVDWLFLIGFVKEINERNEVVLCN